MTWTILIIIIVGSVLFLFLKPKVQVESERIESESNDYPYSKLETLFSPAERSFLGILTQAIGDNKAQIFGKVRVADVITPKKGLSKSEWQKAFNKISRKHFDFILCNKDDLSIICAVELDDSSHQSLNRKDRDLFLESACKSSSVPLIRVQAKSAYNIIEIKELFALYFIKDSIDEEIEKAMLELESLEQGPTLDKNKEKVCPKCSSQLVRKIAKKGNNIGKEFLACSSFPKCRYIEESNA